MACGAVTIVLTLEMTGRTNPHIEMLSLALLGLAAGTRDLHWIGRTLCQPALLVGAYVGYSAALFLWNATYALQVIGVCLNLAILYSLANAWESDGSVHRTVVRLGRYSLVAYIVQIGVLQALRGAVRSTGLSDLSPFVPLALAVAATTLCVELTDMLRSRSKCCDWLYRAVFA